ncbi:single-stranded DNA-binding protein [Tenacibaculum maritimum]|uniref:single-stranded DNA-binding protein n=1 Tax=Tenacibaculum maritimum TaxID=107401 RepID=UPI003876DBCA
MLQNQVQLIGNLGADIELKELGDKSVANFSLASNEDYKNAQGEKVAKSVWHRCTAWGKTAEILANHAKKGTKLCIKGKLIYGKYVKVVGTEEITIPTTEILIEEFLFLGGGDKKTE